jgi:hypothetical protein
MASAAGQFRGQALWLGSLTRTGWAGGSPSGVVPEQFDALWDMGCTWGPGWLWHPALPAEDVDALLRRAS